ncbi:E3 ubiquitin-protein ligase [Arachis hypogaea]|nr:E3 ubiquitin-protein ligase [Arachis hypogaea]
MYSPPPPSIVLGDGSDDDDSSSGFQFSPLIVAVIGILASTFILVTYYTVISRFCRNRGRVNDQANHSNDDTVNNNEPSQVAATSGMDEAQINR